MVRISRRQFCQFAGSTLATLGFSQLNFQAQADRYGKVLAQSTPRKLALLVGINSYLYQPLRGCVNDIELQRHLLIHRFGFNPNDILILTDQKATRQGILAAFEEHLIKQAKPGDVVVYHYSGHGSRIFDPDPIVVSSTANNSGLNGTFVPVNSSLPTGYPAQGGVVQDIMGHTLFLLMSAVKSENLTVVLDSCYSGGATRDLRSRSRAGGRNILVSPDEKSYQEMWLSRLNLSREDFIKGYQAGVAKGVVLTATNPKQTAVDERLNGFFAGAFTYRMTQYIWQQSSTVDSAIAYVRQQIPQRYNQTPGYEVKVGSGYERQPLYLINNPRPAANAVVTEVRGNQATLWLGGFDAKGLASLENGTAFRMVDGTAKVTMRSRAGLVGIGTIEGVVTPGTLLRKPA